MVQPAAKIYPNRVVILGLAALQEQMKADSLFCLFLYV